MEKRVFAVKEKGANIAHIPEKKSEKKKKGRKGRHTLKRGVFNWGRENALSRKSLPLT